MRAILVSVDYGDLLAITLPYNRHHFDEMMVVTTPDDEVTQRVAIESHCSVFTTKAFYDDGAYFNKWKALEQGLNAMGRYGVLCLLDADILWPKEIEHNYVQGNIYGTYRRILLDPTTEVSDESEWRKLPRHRDPMICGYTQIFWAEDSHLPKPPWHEQDWRHAGGADSMFTELWPAKQRIRLPWEVLHIGPTFTNWCGRHTETTEGTLPDRAVERKGYMEEINRLRRKEGARTNYKNERI